MAPHLGPFFLFRPSKTDIRALEKRIPTLQYNFPHVGSTTSGSIIPNDHPELNAWAIQCSRSQIGHGKQVFLRAINALQHWHHFNFNWAFTNAPPLNLGSPVVVIAQSLLLWSMNPLAITDVTHTARRFSYSHTTLQGHQISGEEQFSVEWDKGDNSVWFQVLTVSKPATRIAVMASPLLNYYQRTFVQQSIQAMRIKASEN